MVNIAPCHVIAAGDIIQFVPEIAVSASQVGGEMDKQLGKSKVAEKGVVAQKKVSRSGRLALFYCFHCFSSPLCPELLRANVS